MKEPYGKGLADRPGPESYAGYDRAGNRLYRENTGSSAKDESYTYDGMYQLENFDRGDLNSSSTVKS